MLVKPPARNLPPDSERWGRYVEDSLSGLSQETTETSQSTTNNLRGLNATLTQATEQLNMLNAAVQVLNQNVIDTANLANSIPVSTVQTAAVSGFQAGNGLQTRLQTSFTVPAGKTRCSILASYEGFFVSDFSVPNSERAAFRIAVSGGYNGPWGSFLPDNMDTYWLAGNGGVQLSGVSGTVTVSVQSNAGPTLAPAYPDNRLDLFVLAVFS